MVGGIGVTPLTLAPVALTKLSVSVKKVSLSLPSGDFRNVESNTLLATGYDVVWPYNGLCIELGAPIDMAEAPTIFAGVAFAALGYLALLLFKLFELLLFKFVLVLLLCLLLERTASVWSTDTNELGSVVGELSDVVKP